ncbi:MAG: hypothetical protein JSR61_19935 [Proteobacteria bacterium]|nr:hypothetical protein [Pseudomonadota bacterium]
MERPVDRTSLDRLRRLIKETDDEHRRRVVDKLVSEEKCTQKKPEEPS